MTKRFTKYPCNVCGEMVTNCGFGSYQHHSKHKREGLVKTVFRILQKEAHKELKDQKRYITENM